MADDDANMLKGLEDSLGAIREQQASTMTGTERVKAQYGEWAKTVAFPVMKKIQKTLKANGAATELLEPKGPTSPVGIQVAYQGSGQPSFLYMLFLHENTGPDRAFVMKRRTVPNLDYGMPGDQGENRAIKENVPFWDEHSDTPRNHAPDITAKHIADDFTEEFTAYRNYQWPKKRT